MQAWQYGHLIIEKELRDFEAMLDECLGVGWQQQQEEALQVETYIAAKKQMLKRHVEEFNTK